MESASVSMENGSAVPPPANQPEDHGSGSPDDPAAAANGVSTPQQQCAAAPSGDDGGPPAVLVNIKAEPGTAPLQAPNGEAATNGAKPKRKYTRRKAQPPASAAPSPSEGSPEGVGTAVKMEPGAPVPPPAKAPRKRAAPKGKKALEAAATGTSNGGGSGGSGDSSSAGHPTGAVKAEVGGQQTQLTDQMKVKKKRDRFKGMTEAEVLQKVLPDHIQPNLDILIVGINPGLTAAFTGHHYAGPGNHFWKCMYLSGLIPEPMNALQDRKLLEFGIGFTNIVERTSRGSADLTRKEIQEGAKILTEKIVKYTPKIAVFNGKGIYEVFVGHKKFNFGLQPERFPGCDTYVFVNPSSSARCTQLPRAVDKVPFYAALKKLRDYSTGRLATLNPDEIIFPSQLITAPRKVKKEEEGEEGEFGGLAPGEGGEGSPPTGEADRALGAGVPGPSDTGVKMESGVGGPPAAKPPPKKRGRPSKKAKATQAAAGEGQGEPAGGAQCGDMPPPAAVPCGAGGLPPFGGVMPGEVGEIKAEVTDNLPEELRGLDLPQSGVVHPAQGGVPYGGSPGAALQCLPGGPSGSPAQPPAPEGSAPAAKPKRRATRKKAGAPPAVAVVPPVQGQDSTDGAGTGTVSAGPADFSMHGDGSAGVVNPSGGCGGGGGQAPPGIAQPIPIPAASLGMGGGLVGGASGGYNMGVVPSAHAPLDLQMTAVSSAGGANATGRGLKRGGGAFEVSGVGKRAAYGGGPAVTAPSSEEAVHQGQGGGVTAPLPVHPMAAGPQGAGIKAEPMDPLAAASLYGMYPPGMSPFPAAASGYVAAASMQAASMQAASMQAASMHPFWHSYFSQMAAANGGLIPSQGMNPAALVSTAGGSGAPLNAPPAPTTAGGAPSHPGKGPAPVASRGQTAGTEGMPRGGGGGAEAARATGPNAQSAGVQTRGGGAAGRMGSTASSPTQSSAQSSLAASLESLPRADSSMSVASWIVNSSSAASSPTHPKGSFPRM